MEKIKLTFLGTGNAIPTEKRNHTAILLTYKNENILVDCGEGTQRQFKYAKISPSKITRILITHWHGDHFLGLPGLIQTLATSDYQKTLKIYGPKGTRYFIDLIKKPVNVKLNIEAHEVEKEFISEKEFFVTASKMSHGTPALAYSFNIREERRILKEKIEKYNLPNSPLMKKLKEGKDIEFEGKKIKASSVTKIQEGRKVTFILDTEFNQNALSLAKDSDILICESSFAEEEKAKAKEYLHLTATEAASIAKKANVKKLILTHISQRYEHNTKVIEREAKKVFKSVPLAKDLDSIEL